MKGLVLGVAVSLALLVHAVTSEFEDCSAGGCDVESDNCRTNHTCTEDGLVEFLEVCWFRFIDDSDTFAPLRRKRDSQDKKQQQHPEWSWYNQGSQQSNGFKGWTGSEQQRNPGSQEWSGQWYDTGSQQSNGFKGWSGNEQHRNPESQEWSGQWYGTGSQQSNGFKGWRGNEQQRNPGSQEWSGQWYDVGSQHNYGFKGWSGNEDQGQPRTPHHPSFYPVFNRGYEKVLPSQGSSYRSFHYSVPKPSYRRSFREGNWHLDNKHLVKNYYKKGTYETAKKYFIALPFVKIIPVTKTTSVDYVGHLQTYNGYKAQLCEHCGHGSPQIEFQSTSDPYRNVIRRFHFLPDTKRTRTEYGEAKIVQTGDARISEGKETSRHVQH